MYLHREFLENRWKKSITWKSEDTYEKLPEDNNLVRLRRRSLLFRRWTTVTRGKETSFFIFLDKFTGNF
jgi:hypothetical protein